MDKLGQIMHCEDNSQSENGAIISEPIPLGNADIDRYFRDCQSVEFFKKEMPTDQNSEPQNFIPQNCFGLCFNGFELQQSLIANPTESSQNKHEEIKCLNPTEIYPLQQNDPDIENPPNQNASRLKMNGSQTKNIPKNFGKQIIKFIQKNKEIIQKVIKPFNIDYKEFVKQLKMLKKQMTKLSNLRFMWTEFKYAKPVRIISQNFLRKRSYEWIFNSRIQQIKHPIKYRHRIIEGVKNPEEFEYLKQY